MCGLPSERPIRGVKVRATTETGAKVFPCIATPNNLLFWNPGNIEALEVLPGNWQSSGEMPKAQPERNQLKKKAETRKRKTPTSLKTLTEKTKVTLRRKKKGLIEIAGKKRGKVTPRRGRKVVNIETRMLEALEEEIQGIEINERKEKDIEAEVMKEGKINSLESVPTPMTQEGLAIQEVRGPERIVKTSKTIEKRVPIETEKTAKTTRNTPKTRETDMRVETAKTIKILV